jgi:hypothetical protein
MAARRRETLGSSQHKSKERILTQSEPAKIRRNDDAVVLKDRDLFMLSASRAGACSGATSSTRSRRSTTTAVVDPFEPPLPARVSLEQAAMFATSLVRGQPNRERIALTVFGDRVRELV